MQKNDLFLAFHIKLEISRRRILFTFHFFGLLRAVVVWMTNFLRRKLVIVYFVVRKHKMSIEQFSSNDFVTAF